MAESAKISGADGLSTKIVGGAAAAAGFSSVMSMIPPRSERKVYASTDGGVSWQIIKDGFEEPAELVVTPAKRLRTAR